MPKFFEAPRYAYPVLLVSGVLTHWFIYWQALQHPVVAPMNDLKLYEWWLQQALAGFGWYGITTDWVYPYPAIVPMLAAQVLSNGAGLLIGWVFLFSTLHIAAALTLRYLFGKRGFTAAILWYAFLLLLGPVSISRIDTAASLSAIFGMMLWLRGNQNTAALIFAFGAWLKIWPAAFLASLVSFSRAAVRPLLVAALFSLALILLPIGLTGSFSALSFIFSQTERGLQIEAVFATWYLWLAKLSDSGYGIYYDEKMVTNQVFGPDIDFVAQILNLLLLAAVAAILYLGGIAVRRRIDQAEFLLTSTLAITIALIVFNKVGSPQFIGWLIVPVMGLVLVGSKLAKGSAVFALFLGAFTNLVYPVWYLDLMSLGITSLVLLSIRNLLLVAFFVWVLSKLLAMTRVVR